MKAAEPFCSSESLAGDSEGAAKIEESVGAAVKKETSENAVHLNLTSPPKSNIPFLQFIYRIIAGSGSQCHVGEGWVLTGG